MPEWLKALLAKNHSTGMVDSLSTLVGVSPSYKDWRFDSHMVNGQRVSPVAEVGREQSGSPVILMSKQLKDGFDGPLPKGYRGAGYVPPDPNIRFGDATIQHEFGHLAAYYAQPELSSGLYAAYPDADRSEEFADSFQSAFQFLRSGIQDMSHLDPKTQAVANAILRHPLYHDHPINKAKAVQGFLKGVMQQ